MGVMEVDLFQRYEPVDLEHVKKFKRGKRSRHGGEDINYGFASVISIDPGGTTGWSLMCVEPYALSDPKERILRNITLHQHGELPSNDTPDGYNEVTDILIDLIMTWPQAAVVIEDFVIRNPNRSREFLSPVRITEKLDYILWKHDRTWYRQTPADAKTTATDARLREWGLFVAPASKMVHARDADRHGITFLRKTKEKPEKQAKVWPHLYAEGGVYA